MLCQFSSHTGESVHLLSGTNINLSIAVRDRNVVGDKYDVEEDLPSRPVIAQDSRCIVYFHSGSKLLKMQGARYPRSRLSTSYQVRSQNSVLMTEKFAIYTVVIRSRAKRKKMMPKIVKGNTT